MHLLRPGKSSYSFSYKAPQLTQLLETQSVNEENKYIIFDEKFAVRYRSACFSLDSKDLNEYEEFKETN